MKNIFFYIVAISLHVSVQPSEPSAFQERETEIAIATPKQKKHFTKKHSKVKTRKDQRVNLASLYYEENRLSDPYKNFAILLNQEEEQEEQSCEPCRESQSPVQDFNLHENETTFQEDDPLEMSVSLEEFSIQYQPIIDLQPLPAQEQPMRLETASLSIEQQKTMQMPKLQPHQSITHNSAKKSTTLTNRQIVGKAKSKNNQTLGNALPKNNTAKQTAKNNDEEENDIMDDVEECGCALFEFFFD